MTDRELMEQAIEAMEYADACLKKQLTAKTKHEYAQDLLFAAGTALRERLAQPEQKPVQVSPLDFNHMTLDKEHLVGKPIFWAQWPNEEKVT